jgi:hypothetical protein
MIAIAEVKGTLPAADPHYGHHEAPAQNDPDAHDAAADAALAPAE